MNYKQYRNLRMAVAFFLAMIMSQAVIFENYILAIVAVLTAMVLVIFAKRKVKDVLADERDYEIAGKSARLALGIFSAVASVAVMFFMFQRSTNPVYELIGTALAYAVCGQLLLYSAFFYYYEKQN